MVTLSTIAQAQPQTKPETNGNEMAQLLSAFKLQQEQINNLTAQLAQAKRAPVKSVKRELTLTRADFKREAKEIHLSASEHLGNVVMKPSINQNNTWMWQSEELDGEVEIGGQVVKAIIKHVVYISGSKDRP